MYQVIYYETINGNRPIKRFLEKLLKQHKQDEITTIFHYLKKLEEHGFEINTKFKANAIKPLRDEIYELRPDSTRIFFFHYHNNQFVLLHAYEKKQNKTDPNEIEKAIKEKKRFFKYD